MTDKIDAVLMALKSAKEGADGVDVAVFMARLSGYGYKVSEITNVDRIKMMEQTHD